MGDQLTTFITVTAAAVVLQMLILLGMFLIIWKLSKRVQDVEARVLPLVEDGKKLAADAKAMLENARPKIDLILENASSISSTAKDQTHKLDESLTTFMERARLQVIRADELLTRTFDRVEDTGSKVQNTVLSPIRHLNGVLQGIGVGLETFFAQPRRPRNGSHDEMFI
jgi:hypothetical protein